MQCLSLAGVFLHYGIIQLSLWWIFHLLIIFWGIYFPFHYNRNKSNGRLKKVQIMLTLAGIFVPLLFVLAVVIEEAVSIRPQQNTSIISQDLGYSIFSYPPTFCTPSSFDSAFYFLLLPLILTFAAGGPLILLIIYQFINVSCF